MQYFSTISLRSTIFIIFRRNEDIQILKKVYFWKLPFIGKKGLNWNISSGDHFKIIARFIVYIFTVKIMEAFSHLKILADNVLFRPKL